MSYHRGQIKPIGISGLLAILSMAAAGWFLIWAFTGIFSELHHYLTNLQ